MTTADSLPYSQACENNKAYILDILKVVFADRSEVLEIASGTGQHACHLSTHMPWLRWQPTELAANLPVLAPRCAACPGDNLLQPQALDVRDVPWSLPIPDALFTANSLHIMAFSAVTALFSMLGQAGGSDMTLAIYGPFNYGGKYTSSSNAQFDQWLAARDPESAIRDFEKVNTLAEAAGFGLSKDFDMPANNRLLVWRNV